MELKIYKILNQKKYQVISLGIIWLIIQCFMLWHNGIVTDLEATKYINEANHFLSTGAYSSGNFLFYSTQILLIAFCLKLQISFLFIVIIQMLFNGLSIVCFYKLTNIISKNLVISWIATFYFLIFFYYHLYNTYLFTESLFFSLSVIYSWFLFTRKKLSLKTGIYILLFLTLLYFTRPTGIFFIPATYLFLVLKFYPRNAFKVLIVSGFFMLIALFLAFNFSLASGGEFNFLLPYLNEMTICGVPTISIPHQITIPVEKNSIQSLFYIVTHYFDLFFSLALKRLSAFFGVSRTFYSIFHNIVVSAYFYLIYLAILFGIRNLFKKNKPEAWFFITNIILMATTVMLSCDEWGNRFILSVMPFFLLLAIIAISNTLNVNREKNG